MMAFLGVVLMLIGGIAVLASIQSTDDSAPVGCAAGAIVMIVGMFGVFVWRDWRTPAGRDRAARATIAAATAAVTDATAESELRALERAAATAAAAVNGGDE